MPVSHLLTTPGTRLAGALRRVRLQLHSKLPPGASSLSAAVECAPSGEHPGMELPAQSMAL